MIIKDVPLTYEGAKELRKQIANLEKERAIIAEKVGVEARKGDRKENFEYKAAKEAQALVEDKITQLRIMVNKSYLAESSDASRVVFGVKVEIFDIDGGGKRDYKIVGEGEADLQMGTISINAPLVRAMIGKSAGDSFEFVTPGGGVKHYKIISISL